MMSKLLRNILNSTIFNQKQSARWYLVGILLTPLLVGLFTSAILLLYYNVMPVYQWVVWLSLPVVLVVVYQSICSAFEYLTFNRIRNALPASAWKESTRVYARHFIEEFPEVTLNRESSRLVEGCNTTLMNEFHRKLNYFNPIIMTVMTPILSIALYAHALMMLGFDTVNAVIMLFALILYATMMSYGYIVTNAIAANNLVLKPYREGRVTLSPCSSIIPNKEYMPVLPIILKDK